MSILNKPKWKEFEELAANILEAITSESKVVLDDRIYGHLTQQKRQIDVSIRSKIGNRDILAIVQARDHKKPADINDVGEFESVIRDVRATKGILICKGGFTEKAKIYAKNIGIDLLNLHDAQSKNWNLEIQLPVLWAEFKTDLFLDLEIDSPEPLIAEINSMDNSYFLTEDAGKSYVNLISTFNRWWNDGSIPKIPNHVHKINMSQEFHIKAMRESDNQTVWIPVTKLSFVYEIKPIKYLLGYFQPSELKGVIDYHDDEAFIASHLPPLDEIPKIPEKDWVEIKDPKTLPIDIKGTILSVRAIQEFNANSFGKMTIDGNEPEFVIK